ncbi:hypothetical protein Moror_17893 [Moniliophthora roreri MCA 2997]|uniref:Uncharacterized protein n=1 Tax=Moniliophthora roreri (strain MCA 2997) TaxID=1381753 RepID=V2XTZ4_MONRO|nr:hypothetical protein Moror_17893 [Moniliophthora roreri MCA 2997]
MVVGLRGPHIHLFGVYLFIINNITKFVSTHPRFNVLSSNIHASYPVTSGATRVRQVSRVALKIYVFRIRTRNSLGDQQLLLPATRHI